MTDMPKKNKSETEPLDAAAQEPAIIYVEYNGRAAKRQGQRGVGHTYSPYILNLYQDGVDELPLHPGVNPVDRELFERYKQSCADMRNLVSGGRVRRLYKLPPHADLVSGDVESGTGGLIARTMRPDGLDWIEDRARESGMDGLDEVLELIEQRRPYARPVGFNPQPFVSHRGIDEREATLRGRRPQPSHVGV